jgi:hypothetical protein
MPAMFARIFFNALMQMVIIPAEGKQHALLFLLHGVGGQPRRKHLRFQAFPEASALFSNNFAALHASQIKNLS